MCVCGGDDGRESVPLHAHYHLFIWKTSLHRSTAGSLGHAGSRVPVCVCAYVCVCVRICLCVGVLMCVNTVRMSVFVFSP